MTGFPKITIITPTYNQGDFIEKSILSVIGQNYPNLEYIIIDGGSTDVTISIIKKYEKYISYWISEKDSGQSSAINKGLKKATGDIINWLNSDDFLETNSLYTIADSFNDEKINVVVGYSNYVNEKGELIPNMNFRTHIAGKDIFSVIANTSINQPSTFFRKNVFDEITPLNEKLHYNMDLYLWLRYLCIYGTSKILTSDQNFSTVTIHENAKTIKNFEKTFFEKEFIYVQLFNSIIHKTSDLEFRIESIDRNKLAQHNLKKYYFRYRIFKRNLLGKRKSISFLNIIKYFFYSIKTI